MHLGMVGLGRMGGNMVRRLMRGGHACSVNARTAESVKKMEAEGAHGAYSLQELVKALPKPRTVWVMVPAGDVTITVAATGALHRGGEGLLGPIARDLREIGHRHESARGRRRLELLDSH